MAAPIDVLPFSRRRTEEAGVLAVGHHLSMFTCEVDASTAIAWVVPVRKLLKDSYQKEQKQASIKRFLKRNLTYVGMTQWMNTLADRVQKREVHACTVICTL